MRHLGRGLARIAEEYGADELMLSTAVPIQSERVASYERAAKVCGPPPAK